MPQISIIVPVYNVEPYLRKCIDSILAQTFTDFECILIDDGSPDNCPAICDEYAAKDSRIIVIHQKNAGVSAARNAGLDIARGEWIGFVDSDDWCDPGMFEFLLGNAEKHHADISICGIRQIKENGNIFIDQKKCPDLLMNSHDALIKLFSYGYFAGFSQNKLIKKRLFSYNDEIVRYDKNIHYHEDILLLFSLFKRAQKIFYSTRIFFNYRWRHDSAARMRTTKGVTEKSITVFDAYKKMLQMENDKKIKNRIMFTEGNIAVSSYLRYINAYNKLANGDISLLLRDIVKKDIIYILWYGTIKQKLLGCLIFSPIRFIYLYYRLRHLLRKE